MKNVPKIISSKDLSYISDMLNWLHTISKKLNHYTDLIEDTKILKEIDNLNNILGNIYNDLLNILK